MRHSNQGRNKCQDLYGIVFWLTSWEEKWKFRNRKAQTAVGWNRKKKALVTGGLKTKEEKVWDVLTKQIPALVGDLLCWVWWGSLTGDVRFCFLSILLAAKQIFQVWLQLLWHQQHSGTAGLKFTQLYFSIVTQNFGCELYSDLEKKQNDKTHINVAEHGSVSQKQSSSKVMLAY